MFSFDGEERPLPIRIAAMLIWVEAAFVFIYGMAFGAAGVMFSSSGAISMGPLTGSGGTAVAIAVAFFIAAIALGFVANTLKHPSSMVRNVVFATQAMVAVFALVFASDATGLLIHAVPVFGVVICLVTAEGRQAVVDGDRPASAIKPASAVDVDAPSDDPTPAEAVAPPAGNDDPAPAEAVTPPAGDDDPS